MKHLFAHIIYRLQLRESWIIFFILGIIMMSFPFLQIFNKPLLLFGVPLLFLYLTVGWMISILVIYLFVVANRKANRPPEERSDP